MGKKISKEAVGVLALGVGAVVAVTAGAVATGKAVKKHKAKKNVKTQPLNYVEGESEENHSDDELEQQQIEAEKRAVAYHLEGDLEDALRTIAGTTVNKEK